MAESYGWTGKILRVDLTTGEITTQDDAKYHKYIGGMGMAYRIMYEEAPMDLDPYDEKAQVIFGVGPLTGAGVPCSGRMNVTFRSTWSKGSSIIDAHMGGHIGSMLKYAGYDGIVVSGISEKPVYLRIEDDQVSLEDASDIWGKGTFAANKWMVEQNGREFETASIGPAGENLVDYSTVYLDVQEVRNLSGTNATTIPERISNGLSNTLYGIKVFFENLLVFLVVNLPVFLLLAVVILLIIWVLRLIRRKRSQKNEPVPSAAPPKSADKPVDSPDKNNR